MGGFKEAVIVIMARLRIFPNIYFLSNPFKIYEFNELVKGVRFSGEDVALDLGCGAGIQTLCIGKKCKHIIGIDPNKDDIHYARMLSSYVGGRISSEFKCGELEEENFCDNCFEKVFSICVIEHISNYEEIFEEVYRILKPGGKFIFSVDCLETIDNQELLEKHKREHNVVKYFKADELKKILERSGFKNNKIYSIFTSDFSRKLFIKGIKKGFRFPRLCTLPYIIMLSVKESLSRNEKGIFLIAKCEQ